jgi:hypothetical protein
MIHENGLPPPVARLNGEFSHSLLDLFEFRLCSIFAARFLDGSDVFGTKFSPQPLAPFVYVNKEPDGIWFCGAVA